MVRPSRASGPNTIPLSLSGAQGATGEFEPEEAAAGFWEFGAGGAALGLDQVFYDGEAEAVAFFAAGGAWGEMGVFVDELGALGDGKDAYNSAQKASRLTPDCAIRPARVPGLIGRCIGTTTVRFSRRRITCEPV